MSPDKKSPPEFKRIDRKRCESDAVSAVRELVSARKRWFESAVANGCDALEICRAYSDGIDDTVCVLYEIANRRLPEDERRLSAVLALGGYGRREMGLSSDIDLLFLVADDDTERAKEITDGILYPFWDSGVEVGGATRTLGDCISIMEHDARALTAMMDARLIAGDAGLLESLRRAVHDHFSSRSSREKYIEDKVREHRERLERFGGSIYLLQPNLKEGEGGLRELHTLRWTASAARHGIDARDAVREFAGEGNALRKLESSHGFLWAVRHALHIEDASSNDRLSESAQRAVARRLDYESIGVATPDEALMSDYYMYAERMHLTCERGIELVLRDVKPPSRARVYLRRRRVPGGIMRTEYGSLMLRKREGEIDPLTELNLFATSRRIGLPVDPVTKGRLGAMAESKAHTELGSFEARRSLRDIFSGIENLERTLLDMQECGALVRWFPEMAPMLHRVQHDGFHFYTAGIHSIRAVGHIEQLTSRKAKREQPLHRRALSRVKRRHVLALATLLHDVGKGRGVDHSIKGAELAEGMARRIGFSESDVRDVGFLVRSHLLMSMLAFRRDIKDFEMVERFAQSIRTPEVLAMLYLLTIADIKAVGPNIWSDWKGGLLGELYSKTHDFMTAGGMTSDRRRREMERVVSNVMRKLGRDVERDYVRDYLAKLPERYIHSISPDAIAAHILLARDIETNPMATFLRDIPEMGCTELSVVTKDSPGLFAKIAGVLAANSANVVDAQIYTSRDGTAIDVLWVTRRGHGESDEGHAWSKIRKDFAKVLPAESDITKVVGGRFKRRLLDVRPVSRPTEVSIENDVSALHTVVEVRTDDRRGLLYTIASTFHGLDLTIDLARITTHIDRVIDVFYIRGSGGRKIDSRERLDAIREKLMEALK